MNVPLSQYDTRARRRWRFMIVLAMTLSSVSILVSVVLHNQIQDQRKDSIFTSCIEQNRRHIQTIRTLNRLIARLPEGPQKKRAKAGKVGTVLLIDALAPVRDCRALVEATVQRP